MMFEAEENLCDGCGSKLSVAGDDCISRGVVDEDIVDCQRDPRHCNRTG